MIYQEDNIQLFSILEVKDFILAVNEKFKWSFKKCGLKLP